MSRRVTKAPRTEIGRRLLITRLALGYAIQADFAEAIGVEPQTYNEWETGTRGRSLSRRGIGFIVAKFPAISVEWLMEGCPDRLPHGLVKKIQELDASIPPPGSPDKIIRIPRI